MVHNVGYFFFAIVSLWAVFLSLFSWNIGPAHIISLSTEVYHFYQYGLEQIVQQYEWLEKDLQVRKKTINQHFYLNKSAKRFV